MPKTLASKKTGLRIIIPPFIGLIFYGGWAYWVNRDYGQMIALKAAITQGGYSFTITLVSTVIVEWLFKVLYWLPYHSFGVGLIACVLLYITSWSINAVAGTPDILLTILPGTTIGTLFIILYIITSNKS